MRVEAHVPFWSLRLASFFTIASLFACDANPQAGMDSGGQPQLDVGGFDASAPSVCDLQEPAALIEGACSTSADCGAAGICVGDGTGGASCAALCFPEDCDDPCGERGECVGLGLADGSDFRFDANGDGTAELWGACFGQSAELAPVWGDCGSGGDCVSDALCARIPGRGGTCFPVCDGICPLYDGFVPECLGTSGGGASICVILCDPANGAAACPPGLQCTNFGQGAAVCSR